MDMTLKLVFLLWAASMPSIMAAAAEAEGEANHATVKIAIGGYAGKITTIQFDPLARQFSNISTTAVQATGNSPSYFTFSPDGQFVYVANEVSSFEGKIQTGSVSSFKLAADGSMAKVATALTGADPVFLMVSPNSKNLIVADYTGGSWSRHSLDVNGRFSSANPVQVMKYSGSGPNRDRQAHSFLHQAVYDPTGRLAFFVDLGGDSVYIHRVDQKSGALSAEVTHHIKVAPGSGPRHLSMIHTHTGEYDIYLICELSNEILNIRLADKAGTLTSTIRQKLSTLPPGITDTKGFGAGEVAVTRDGRFVYATNRQTNFSRLITENSFVRFSRHANDGLLEPTPAIFPITLGGKTPRHFSFSRDPLESLVVVGCHQSNTVLVYHRKAIDGSLELISSTNIELPTVQFFLPEPKHHRMT